MDERTVTLENAYYRNVLYVIEQLLIGIPCPAHIEERTGRKATTEYRFYEPKREEDLDTRRGRITLNYYQNTVTEFGAMAGLVFEHDPIVFECFEGGESDQVIVKGYCTARKESEAWIMPIFGNIWQKLLETFSS